MHAHPTTIECMQSERAGGHLARSSAVVLPISLHKQHLQRIEVMGLQPHSALKSRLQITAPPEGHSPFRTPTLSELNWIAVVHCSRKRFERGSRC